jgi:cytochrome c553
MKTPLTIRWLAAAFVLWAMAPADPASAAGDPQQGRRLAGPCVDCHGRAGIAPDDTMPNLAGQKSGFMVKQLKDMRSSANKRAGLTLMDDIDKEVRADRFRLTRVGRSNEIMDPLVINLSDKDIDDLAAYYSVLPCSTAGALNPPPEPRQAVRCKTCHGASGISTNPMIPNLSGQSGRYIAERLTAYRKVGQELSSKERRRNIMANQARLLKDKDISDLADYFSVLACR